MAKPKAFIKIRNLAQIERELRKLDPKTDKILRNNIRQTLRDSLKPMAKGSKIALKAQGSILTGNLYRAIAVKGRSYRSGYYVAALGAKAKHYRNAKVPPTLRVRKANSGWHLHFPNSGTKKRWHKSGHYTGKVPGKNSKFRIGFMDNVIRPNISNAVFYVIRKMRVAIANAYLRMNT